LDLALALELGFGFERPIFIRFEELLHPIIDIDHFPILRCIPNTNMIAWLFLDFHMLNIACRLCAKSALSQNKKHSRPFGDLHA